MPQFSPEEIQELVLANGGGLLSLDDCEWFIDEIEDRPDEDPTDIYQELVESEEITPTWDDDDDDGELPYTREEVIQLLAEKGDRLEAHLNAGDDADDDEDDDSVDYLTDNQARAFVHQSKELEETFGVELSPLERRRAHLLVLDEALEPAAAVRVVAEDHRAAVAEYESNLNEQLEALEQKWGRAPTPAEVQKLVDEQTDESRQCAPWEIELDIGGAAADLWGPQYTDAQIADAKASSERKLAEIRSDANAEIEALRTSGRYDDKFIAAREEQAAAAVRVASEEHRINVEQIEKEMAASGRGDHPDRHTPEGRARYVEALTHVEPEIEVVDKLPADATRQERIDYFNQRATGQALTVEEAEHIVDQLDAGEFEETDERPPAPTEPQIVNTPEARRAALDAAVVAANQTTPDE